jgi:hypothetical protein
MLPIIQTKPVVDNPLSTLATGENQGKYATNSSMISLAQNIL